MKRYVRRTKAEDTRNGADFDRLAWIRKQSCCACNAPPPNHAHHLIGDRKGLALKTPDAATMPLCMQCHKDLHEKLGMFRVMNRDDLLSWQRAKVAGLTLLYSRFAAAKLGKAAPAGELAGQSTEFDGDQDPTV